MPKTPEEQLAEAHSDNESLKRIVDTQKKKLETMVAEVEEKTSTLQKAEAIASEKTKTASEKIALVDDLQAELAAVTADRNRLERALDSLSHRMESTRSEQEADVADSQSKMLGLQYELTSRRLQGNDEVLRQHMSILEVENAKLRERILALEAVGTSQTRGARSGVDSASQEWQTVVSGLRDENAVLQRENCELRRHNEDMMTKQLERAVSAVSVAPPASPLRSQPQAATKVVPCPKCAVPKVAKSIRHCTTQTTAPTTSAEEMSQTQEAMLKREIEAIHEQHRKVSDQFEVILATESQEKNAIQAKVDALRGDLKVKALKIAKLTHELESSNAHKMVSPTDGSLLAAQKAAAKAELEVRSLTRRINQMELAREVSLNMSASQRGESPQAAYDDEFLPVHLRVTEAEAKLRARRESTKQNVSDLQKEIRHCGAAVEYWTNEMQHDPSVSSILMNARQRLRQAREEVERSRCDLRSVDSISEAARLSHVSQERGVLMRF